jgi:hypothetical protein
VTDQAQINADSELWLERYLRDDNRRKWEARFMHVDYTDTVCECIHWFEEHNVNGCGSCDCEKFVPSKEFNTAAAIFDRGGEHPKGCNCNACRSLVGLPPREF